MAHDSNPREIRRQLEQAQRLASAAASDPTTYQRIRDFAEELRQKLRRLLTARRSKEQVRRRARELWEQHGRPEGRDLEFWLEAERQLRDDEDDCSVTAMPMGKEGDAMSASNKTLRPDDFPVSAEGQKIKKQDGAPIADTKSPAVAEDVADRLNDDEARREEDKWSA